MIVHSAKSMCFVGTIYLDVSAVFITKQRKRDGTKHRNVKEHWEKRPVKHTLSFQFEFVSIVGSKSVALCFGFYGAQVRLHMNF